MNALLNARDELGARRRNPHHLPVECYDTLECAYCVTLCARHHQEPFLDDALAAPTVEVLRH